TGLGLAYARVIIERQNAGAIRVSSQTGKGTIITIYLPRVDATERSPRRYVIDNGARTGYETILVVAGDDVLRTVISNFLALHGYSILLAKTGDEALGLVEQHSGTIDLLLTDMVVLGMSGFDLAKRLHSTYPKIKKIYVSSDNQTAGEFTSISLSV